MKEIIKNYINYPYNIYLDWYNKKHKQLNFFNYRNSKPSYNPLTILQFYLIFLTLFIMTSGILMVIILMIQSLI